jgi:hypothetical protein
MFRNAWRSTFETVGYDLVQLNHYAVRSAGSFLVKRDRGRVNQVDRDQGLAYWFRMIRNRKDIFVYRQTMEHYLAERGQNDRAARFVAAFKRRKQQKN